MYVTRYRCVIPLLVSSLLVGCGGSGDSSDAGRFDAELAAPVSTDPRFDKYSYEIRPPKGYNDRRREGGGFKWLGELHKGKGKASTPRAFRVRVVETQDNSAESALETELERMAQEYDGLRPGQRSNVVIGPKGLSELSFVRSEFTFENTTKGVDHGPGTGFLYAAVDDGVAIFIDSFALDDGKPDKLQIADAAARSFVWFGKRQ